MSLSASCHLAIPTALIITGFRRDLVYRLENGINRYNRARERQEVRRDLARLPAKLTTESGEPNFHEFWNRIGEWLRRLEQLRKVA